MIFDPIDEYEDTAALLDGAPEPPGGIHGEADGVVLVCGATLKPSPIQWLWPGWLATGKLHILAGQPGTGKTTVSLALAAAVTVGGSFPGGAECPRGRVLFWSSEDDPADTIIPRLLASGGNASNFYVIDGTRRAGRMQAFEPSRDISQLQQAIHDIGGVTLLVIDPMVTAVKGDSHSNTDVRRGLQPLVDLAAACGCAVLGISHFSKGGQGFDPAQRVVGSVAFSAMARVVLACAKVKGLEGDSKRILARSKSNIGPDDGGFGYVLEQAEAVPGINAQRVVWTEAVEGEARDLLADAVQEAGDSDSGDAVEMLRAELTSEIWTNSDIATKPLQAAGFSKKQIWAASKKLAVIRKKGQNGPNDGWYWRLPIELAKRV